MKAEKKAAAEVGPVEGLWELPEGWKWKRARELAKIIGGGTPRNAADPSNFAPDGVPWITPADLSGYARPTIGRGARSLSELGFRNSAARLLPAGTVLVSSRAPVGYCAVAEGPIATNQGFKSLLLEPDVDPFYVRYYVLRSRQYLNDNASGTTFKELSGAAMGELLVPIPPLETQRRIVCRVDELLSDIDDGERALSFLKSNIDTYRKSLLRAAMTGTLTADWRAAHKPNESGLALVKRLEAEQQISSKGVRRRGMPPSSQSETALASGLPELPNGWVWTRLSHLISEGPTNGYSPKSGHRSSGTQSLKLTATSGGKMRLDPDCVKTLDETIGAGSGLFLKEGDLLFQRGNTPDLVGIAAVYDGPPNTFIYPDLMIRVRSLDPVITRWIWRWANSPHGRAHMMSNSQGAAGSMPKISGGTVRGMPVPIGPLDEMAHALELVEKAMAKVDLQQLEIDLSSAQSLRQSILAAAFRGDLVA